MAASDAVQNKQINPKPSGCDCGGCASSAGAWPGNMIVSEAAQNKQNQSLQGVTLALVVEVLLLHEQGLET